MNSLILPNSAPKYIFTSRHKKMHLPHEDRYTLKMVHIDLVLVPKELYFVYNIVLGVNECHSVELGGAQGL